MHWTAFNKIYIAGSLTLQPLIDLLINKIVNKSLFFFLFTRNNLDFPVFWTKIDERTLNFKEIVKTRATNICLTSSCRAPSKMNTPKNQIKEVKHHE